LLNPAAETADQAGDQMTALAWEIARRERFAEPGRFIVAIAGMPFGSPGTTNLIRIATA
jgi:pyruvate kinase